MTLSAHRRAADAERRVLRTVFQPPPRMTVDEWADAYRFLSPEASAEPGKYSVARAPYQREPMRSLSDPLVKEVVLMWPSQVGKTEIANNFVGQRIHLAPGPMLVLQPTLQMGEAWSKDRLAPMIRDTPTLHGKVKDARSRDADNTLLHKKFPGGHITIAGANSPAGLASRPIRDVLCDEVDRYPLSAGSEGDPIGLAFRRASTFRNGKRLIISSPTVKGQSRIEAEYEDSTRERWTVPCPHCGELQVIRWGGAEVGHGIKWDAARPETAHFVCVSGCVVEEAHKAWMNAHGQWIAEAEHATTRGFWLNALYSPWVPWSDLVREFLAVKHDAIRLRQFVNTVLCETWEDAGEQVEAHALADRFEAYPCDCAPGTHESSTCDTRRLPTGVAVLVRTVDTQGDRLETAVWGFGEGSEVWPVEHELLPGDPGIPEGQAGSPWTALAERIGKAYRHASGVDLRPSVTGIDAGGHHAAQVYAFTRSRVAHRVYALHGSTAGEGAPLLNRPTRNNSAKAILFTVGVFTAKEWIMSQLARNRAPGPGYIHIPDWLDGEHLEQLTAEKLITKIVSGRPKRLWLKTRARNEFLDLLAYALGMLQALGPQTVRHLGTIAQRHADEGAKLAAAGSQPAPAPDPLAALQRPASPRRGNSWVNGWRK